MATYPRKKMSGKSKKYTLGPTQAQYPITSANPNTIHLRLNENPAITLFYVVNTLILCSEIISISPGDIVFKQPIVT
jgi:hypothetical protein